MNRLVSIIVPCYNQAQYLPDALNSVLAQTYPDWECIIVDDSSSDNTEIIAQAWTLKDTRFKYIKKENGGPSSARNAGIKVAEGGYLQFLDADDVIHPDKFTFQIQALQNTGDNALSISSYFVSTETDLTQPYPSRYRDPHFQTRDFLHELITDWDIRLSIPVHCFLFKSAIFRNNNILFNERLLNHEDWDCWMNIFRLHPDVRYVDLDLATYRIRESSMCFDSGQMRQGYLQAINHQKDAFHKNSIEYQLLVRKYNFVKYGVSADNLYFVFWGLLNKVVKRVTTLVRKRLKHS